MQATIKLPIILEIDKLFFVWLGNGANTILREYSKPSIAPINDIVNPVIKFLELSKF